MQAIKNKLHIGKSQDASSSDAGRQSHASEPSVGQKKSLKDKLGKFFTGKQHKDKSMSGSNAGTLDNNANHLNGGVNPNEDNLSHRDQPASAPVMSTPSTTSSLASTSDLKSTSAPAPTPSDSYSAMDIDSGNKVAADFPPLTTSSSAYVVGSEASVTSAISPAPSSMLSSDLPSDNAGSYNNNFSEELPSSQIGDAPSSANAEQLGFAPTQPFSWFKNEIGQGNIQSGSISFDQSTLPKESM
eukprot:TRINITY_DN5748_c0_g1_i1.p1 TRINITY_DN5748_c0_g1~~TRINITY_DN5748_c0_g1_i1.p1  ORF type:complete len:243 (+),score=66.69 TRINITY_DN5748_c0_g1_i1:350-1078(+)